jgi:hypothetical protein
MKKAINGITLCAFVLLLNNVALGQKRISKTGTTKQANSPACKGQPIPKGFVIIGYKSSAKCGENSELIVKKPDDIEIVCDTSPVPEGYHVLTQQASAACETKDSNPLTNALSILRDGAAVTVQNPGQSMGSAAKVYRSQPPRSAKPSSDESDSPDTKASSSSPRPSRDEIEIAVRRSTVIIGMEMQDVSRAWGTPRTNDKLVEEDGLIQIWGYAMGKVYFRNGIVYKIAALKGY